MAMSEGKRRANIAFIGARVALESYVGNAASMPDSGPALPENAQQFLTDCLTHDPQHPHSLWCLAAVRWLNGDTAGLAEQAQQMRDPNVTDLRYHYFAALCHLVSQQYEAVIAACERIKEQVGRNGTLTQRVLAIEAGYLAGLARIALNEPHLAVEPLRPITYDPKSPTLAYAQALLGEVLFREKRHDDALTSWQALDAKKRQEWKLNEPLAQTTFISALESLQKAEYEQASEKLRQSGKLGYRDRRLGPLLLLALFKAGQQSIYAGETVQVPVVGENANHKVQETNKEPVVNAQ
jgi:hypothetical protein